MTHKFLSLLDVFNGERRNLINKFINRFLRPPLNARNTKREEFISRFDNKICSMRKISGRLVVSDVYYCSTILHRAKYDAIFSFLSQLYITPCKNIMH